MMNEHTGEQLISELLSNPAQFDQQGRAYELLQEYFHGLPLETLRHLLKSDDVHIQRAAIFISSELGKNAAGLLEDVIPLIHTGNRYLAYHALEVVAVCACGENSQRFAAVILALENEDSALRALAMRLLRNADRHRSKLVQRH